MKLNRINKNWRRYKKFNKRRMERANGESFIFVNLANKPGFMWHEKGMPRSKEARRYHVEWGARMARLDELTRLSEDAGDYFGK